MTAAEFPGELIEILARLVLAFAQDELECGAIARRFRHLARQCSGKFAHSSLSRIARVSLCQPVINILSGAAIRHHPGALQLGEMTGDARLTHPQNVLQFGHGKLFLLEQQQQTQPRRIGEQAQEISG
jgi:hypothetical protein